MLIFNFGKTEKECSKAAAKRQVELLQEGMRPVLTSARHIATLQHMQESELKEHGCILVDEAGALELLQVPVLLKIADSVSVEIYGVRCSQEGKPYESVMQLLAFADEINRIKDAEDLIINENIVADNIPSETVISAHKEETAAADEDISPYLLEFLEADGYNEKLSALRRNWNRFDESMLGAMAVVLDTELMDGDDLELKKNALVQFLETKMKYEVIR